MQVHQPQTDPAGRVGVVRANVLGGVTSVVLVVGYLEFVNATGWGRGLRDFSLVSASVWTIAGLVLHEALHGIGFRAAGIPWSKIRFGLMWKYLMPYVWCSEPMAVESYRFAILLPGWLTGVLPFLVGGALGNHEVAVAGALLMAGAAGDLLVWNKARRLPGGTVVRDLTSGVGFEIVGVEVKIDG